MLSAFVDINLCVSMLHPNEWPLLREWEPLDLHLYCRFHKASILLVFFFFNKNWNKNTIHQILKDFSSFAQLHYNCLASHLPGVCKCWEALACKTKGQKCTFVFGNEKHNLTISYGPGSNEASATSAQATFKWPPEVPAIVIIESITPIIRSHGRIRQKCFLAKGNISQMTAIVLRAWMSLKENTGWVVTWKRNKKDC